MLLGATQNMQFCWSHYLSQHFCYCCCLSNFLNFPAVFGPRENRHCIVNWRCHHLSAPSKQQSGIHTGWAVVLNTYVTKSGNVRRPWGTINVHVTIWTVSKICGHHAATTKHLFASLILCGILSVKTIDRFCHGSHLMYVSNLVSTSTADNFGFPALGSSTSLPVRQRPMHWSGVQQPRDRHCRPRRQDCCLQSRPGRSVSGHRSVEWRLVCVGTLVCPGCCAWQRDLIALLMSSRKCRQ